MSVVLETKDTMYFCCVSGWLIKIVAPSNQEQIEECLIRKLIDTGGRAERPRTDRVDLIRAVG